MCGFGVAVDLYDHREVNPSIIRHMSEQLARRGPDRIGEFTARGVTMVHGRLAIIDPEHGHQPMHSRDGELSVVFNGLIYNYQELQKELSGYGHQFVTNCDTEVLLYAWRQWGAGMVSHLDGVFAFVIWDHRHKKVFAARDPIGEKPFFWMIRDNWLYMASVMNALKGITAYKYQLNYQAVEDFIAYGYIPDPKTIFQDIHKLPPGHSLSWQKGQDAPIIQRYWLPPFRSAASVKGDFQDYKQQLHNLLHQAVAKRLCSDVPMGTFLSGGIDSGGVNALAKHQLPDGQFFPAFSLGYDDAGFDETEIARQVAERYGLDFMVCKRSLDDSVLEMPALMNTLYGEPFADFSALPTYWLSQFARPHVKVIFSGDGGDEVFAGYRRYPFHIREEMVKCYLPSWLQKTVIKPFADIYPQLDYLPRVFRAKATLQALSSSWQAGYLRATATCPDDLRYNLYHKNFINQLGQYHAIQVIEKAACLYEDEDLTPLQRAQAVDFQSWLPGRMLVKTDRVMMGSGIDLRAPLLDHNVVEWAAQIPDNMKLQGLQGKYILREVLRDYLPESHFSLPKRGFISPLRHWITHFMPVIRTKLGDGSPLYDLQILRQEAVVAILNDHETGKRDHQNTIWSLMILDDYLRDHQS